MRMEARVGLAGLFVALNWLVLRRRDWARAERRKGAIHPTLAVRR